ncbi:inhibitor of growth protein 5 isoform X5 [Manis pentadactyla]|nr:inhibitor of growth protein 5 isoform X5 [Manis pentadactyla]
MLAAEYISTVKALSPGQRVEQLRKIQDAYSRCREYSDDKVQLAMQTYEMVDKHIRRLDADLARFEADLKDKLEGSDCEGSGGRGLKKGRGQKEKRGSRGRGRRTSEEDTPKKKKHKGGSEFSDTILSVHPSDVLDMPVDPNEPTYCLCHQVSYGEMIGCDNPDCPIEWFHFACVDLTTKPKGKWSVWGVGLSRPAGVVCTGSPEDRRVDLPSCSLGPSGCGCGGLACDAAWSCFPGSDWQRDICPPLHGSRCLLCLCNTFLLLS